MYVNEDKAFGTGLANVTYEEDVLDWYAEKEKEQKQNGLPVDDDDDETTTSTSLPPPDSNSKKEPFIYMGSAPTEAGPRDSIRLEGDDSHIGVRPTKLDHLPSLFGA